MLYLFFLQNSRPAFSPSTSSPNPTLLYAPPYQLPQRLDPRQTNSKASKDTIPTDSSIKTHHTHKPTDIFFLKTEVNVLKKQRKKNASSEQTSMCPSGVFSFLFFFPLLRHGSDMVWTNVLNIVPFRLGRNVNTENFSYLKSEILGKKGDGRKKWELRCCRRKKETNKRKK